MNAPLDIAAIRRELAAANERLAERDETIRQLRALLLPQADLPLEWELTHREARVFRAMLGVDMLTREAAMAALYSDRPDDAPDQKIVDVFICKLRKKTRPYGVAIDTVWGQGWRLNSRQVWRVRLGVNQ